MNKPILHPIPGTDLAEVGAPEAALIEETRELAADAEVFRLLAHVALAEVARLTRLTTSQAAALRALRFELTRYTAGQGCGSAGCMNADADVRVDLMAEDIPFDRWLPGDRMVGAAETPWWETGPAFARHAEAPLPLMLVHNLVPGDGLTLLHADPRSLKTWIAEDVALAVASNTPALGILPVIGPASVIYVSNEDGRQRTADRFLKLARGRGLPDLPETLLCAVHAGVWLDEASWQVQILGLVESRGVRLVVLDPLRSVTGAVDQGPRELQPFARFLRRLTQAGAAVLLLHHDTKPLPGQADTRKRAYRASGGGLFSIADAPIHGERVGDEAVVLLHPNGWKFAETPGPLEVRLTVTDTTARLEASATSSVSATDRALALKVIEFLTAHPDSSGNKIAQAVRARRELVTRTLEDLADAGTVDSRPGPRHGAAWFLARVFPEAVRT